MLDTLKQKKNSQRIKMRIKTGDLVKIKETRPLSAHKRWAIDEILNKTIKNKEDKKWFNKKLI